MIPCLFTAQISGETMIAQSSIGINTGTTVEGENGGWVKENRTSGSDYDVWSDDWSK